MTEAAAFYPDTWVKLDDETLRYRWASTFFTAARAMRAQFDFGYASEQMIPDGALNRYKLLVPVGRRAAKARSRTDRCLGPGRGIVDLSGTSSRHPRDGRRR